MFKILLISILSFNLWAIDNDTDGYRYSQHEYNKVDLHSNCRFVHRTTATDQYVPTKSSAEWTAFFTNPGTGMLAGPCMPGNVYSGSYTHPTSSNKFYLAQDYDSCDVRCASLGGCNAAGFADITSAADCKTIVEGIIGSVPAYTDAANPAVDMTGAPDSNPNNADDAIGCTFFESVAAKIAATQVRKVTTSAPTCSAMTTSEGYQRVCPCNN